MKQIRDIKNESSESKETVASTSPNLTPFFDCGDMIKEEIKEEVVDESEKDPLQIFK